MTKIIWLKIFSIVLLVVVPLMTVQYLMQRESVEFAFNLAEKSNPGPILESHMALLKELSRFEPENTERFKKEFQSTADSRNIIQDLQSVRARLIDDILVQTLRTAFFVLLLSLLATYIIARGIVSLLRRLVEDNEIQALRLERLNALESWQKVARMMVHELRTPITPIKLVATDMEAKYRSLAPQAFQNYLNHGAQLICSQVKVVERLTEALTQFAKLPEPQKVDGSLSHFIAQFTETYRSYGAGKVRMIFAPKSAVKETPFDPALLNLLFFNLLKNAHEANLDREISVQIELHQTQEISKVVFANTGNAIPAAIATEIFKPHVSTKAGISGTNFGVGLTIAKKIAYDHKGDLHLKNSGAPGDVVFELELPNI